MAEVILEPTETAEEMNMSKLDYHLQEYPQLLAKALVAGKGQKALIKRLYNDQFELVEKCSINDLRRTVYEGSFVAVPEGRKLILLFIPKIGLKNFWLLTKNIMQKVDTTKKLCEFYGEIFLSVWKAAESEEIRRNVELIFEDIVRYAITAKLEISENFRAALEPLLAARNKQIDGMIERILRPNLWRCLKSVNGIARNNACKLFFSFYPVVKEDDLENGELFGVQLNTIADLIVDSSTPIRAYSCRQALYIFSLFWSVFSKQYRKTNFGKIIDKLSRDASSEVRLAVYEGMWHMVPCAEAVNAVESAVKRLIVWGVNDNVVKVRIAALQLLKAFRNHRYIKWWNVIEVQQILERLEVEKVDSVKKKIAELLAVRVFTFNASGDEILKKITYMGNMSRLAVIKFHESIAKHQLITLDQAVEHLIAMGTTAYKLARSYERHHQHSLTAFDVTEISLSSIEPTPPLIVDATKEDDREGARLWRQLCLLVECLTVTWAVLREPLSAKEYDGKRTKLSRLLTKLFGHLLHCFKGSSLAQTILIFGSTLRGGSELTQIANILYKEISCSSTMESTTVAGYIEALANWNLEKVIEIVDKGVNRLQFEFKNFSNQKRSKIKERMDVSRVLLFLETMLKSPTIQQNLIQNFHGFLIKFYVEFQIIKDIILTRVTLKNDVSKDFSLFSPENATRALEIRQTLGILLLNVTKNEENAKILSEVQSDMDWFASLLPFLVNTEDEMLLVFLTTVCQTMLRLISIHLESFSYPREFLYAVSDIIESLCNHKAPHSFIPSVTRALRSLFLALVSIDSQEFLINTIYPLVNTGLIWISARCSDEGFDSKFCAESFLFLLGAVESHSYLTEGLLIDLSKTLLAVVIGALKDLNCERMDVRDLRKIDFEVEGLVDVLIHRILMRNYLFLWRTLNSFKTALEPNVFLEGLEAKEMVYMFGAEIQFLYLCEPNAVKTTTSKSGFLVKLCNMTPKENNDLREVIGSCFGIIKKQLIDYSRGFESNALYDQLLIFCS